MCLPHHAEANRKPHARTGGIPDEDRGNRGKIPDIPHCSKTGTARAFLLFKANDGFLITTFFLTNTFMALGAKRQRRRKTG